MTDNVNVDNNDLPDIPTATDEVGGYHYQKVKLVDSTPDSSTPVGTVANPLFVNAVSAGSSSTATRTQVNDTTVEGILLAANSSRKGGSVTNDSTAVLYLGEGTTVVTSTNYTAYVMPFDFYLIPNGFTGQIRGLWASDPNTGGARITELT